MIHIEVATWDVAALATLGVITRPWNLPEFIWAVAGAVLLVVLQLLGAWFAVSRSAGAALNVTLARALSLQQNWYPASFTGLHDPVLVQKFASFNADSEIAGFVMFVVASTALAACVEARDPPFLTLLVG